MGLQGTIDRHWRYTITNDGVAITAKGSDSSVIICLTVEDACGVSYCIEVDHDELREWLQLLLMALPPEARASDPFLRVAEKTRRVTKASSPNARTPLSSENKNDDAELNVGSVAPDTVRATNLNSGW